MDADTTYASMIILIMARGGGGLQNGKMGKRVRKRMLFVPPLKTG